MNQYWLVNLSLSMTLFRRNLRQRCCNYIFIPDLTPGFNWLGNDNCKTKRETLKFWNWVRLILDVWWYQLAKNRLVLRHFMRQFHGRWYVAKRTSKHPVAPCRVNTCILKTSGPRNCKAVYPSQHTYTRLIWKMVQWLKTSKQYPCKRCLKVSKYLHSCKRHFNSTRFTFVAVHIIT